MKKFKFLIPIFMLVVFVGCNDSSEGPSNEIVIDGDATAIVGAYYDEYGTSYWGPPLRLEGSVQDTHSESVWIFTDGVFGVEDFWPSEYTFYVFSGLFSPGINGFTDGTYTIIDDEPSGDQTGNAFGWLEVNWGTFYGYASGTVTVSNSDSESPKFRFILSVEYWNNAREEGGPPDGTATVTGFYKGPVAERSID